VEAIHTFVEEQGEDWVGASGDMDSVIITTSSATWADVSSGVFKTTIKV
jgi:hypothetical protein